MFHLLDSAVGRLAITRYAREKPTYQKWPIASEAYMAWLPRLTHQRTTTTCEEPFLVVHCTSHWASRHGCDEFRWRSVRMCGVVVHGGVLNRRNEPHPVIIAKPLHTTVKSNHKDHRGNWRYPLGAPRYTLWSIQVHELLRRTQAPWWFARISAPTNRRTAMFAQRELVSLTSLPMLPPTWGQRLQARFIYSAEFAWRTIPIRPLRLD